MTDFSIEKSIDGPVIGLDEVGRGPFFGSLFCGAVIWDDNKEIDEETFKRLTQITVDGTTVKRQYVDETMSMEILDLGMSLL